MKTSSASIAPLLVAMASRLAAGANTTSDDPTLPLSSDDSFKFEFLAPLGEAIYSGADIAPVLGVAKNVKTGDFKSFSHEFYALANHTKAQAEDPENAYDPINVRDTWFSAATYFRRADFYLHSNWSNPLLKSLWAEQTAAFDKALAALPVPGERIRIPTSDFTIEAIWYSPTGHRNTKLPTLVVGNGYDAAQEDSYHTFVVPALARGWNCITYEGPGQSTVRREQNVGFIPDWERVVTPVIDYLVEKKSHSIDRDQLVLLGNSMGGYLAARAAAFEPRLSAVVLDGGVWDVFAAYSSFLSPEIMDMFYAGNKTQFDKTLFAARESGQLPSTAAWGMDQGLWSFNTESPFEFFTKTKKFVLKDVVDRIKMPVWIADAEFDQFFAGQPKQVKAALGRTATLHSFTGVAGYHCQVGAAQEMARVIFGWLHKTLHTH